MARFRLIKNEKERYWLAGLWEGEGCFTFTGSICAKIQTCDEDVIQEVSRLLETDYHVFREAKGNWSKAWHLYLYGDRAIELMLTIRDLMFSRRKKRIDYLLATCKAFHRDLPKNVYKQKNRFRVSKRGKFVGSYKTVGEATEVAERTL